MSEIIKIRKGLSLKLKGEAEKKCLNQLGKCSLFAIVPDHFEGIIPKVVVKPEDSVKAGDSLFVDKRHSSMAFVSPVSGRISQIQRGAKRKVLSIEIVPSAESVIEYKPFAPVDPDKATDEQIKQVLLESGMWGFIRQRPYDIVAEAKTTPRDIYVTGHFTAPLAPDFSYILSLEKNREFFLCALKALKKLTKGKVYLGLEKSLNLSIDNVVEYETKGPHPAGTVGVLINKTNPINKGEVVWTLKATDLITIGKLLKEGKVDFSRYVAITGGSSLFSGYVKLLPGGHYEQLLSPFIPSDSKQNYRVIAGDVLTGLKMDRETPFLPLNTDQITIIPEGDNRHEILGWMGIRLKQFSVSRSYFSWFTKNKRYNLDARIKGGERAMIMSSEFPKVFPLDILPEPLLKAIIAFNIDKMEQLGIYEIAPEDFALCEFVDTSKQPIQEIVRKGLNLLYKEMN